MRRDTPLQRAVTSLIVTFLILLAVFCVAGVVAVLV